MDLAKPYIALTVLLIMIALASCAPSAEPHAYGTSSSETNSSSDANTFPDVNMAASSIAARDGRVLISIARDPVRTERAIKELRSLSWRSLAITGRTGLETVVHDDLRVQVGVDYGDYIKSFGRRYANEELSEYAYVNAMLLIDAFLAGIMHSHETIYNNDIDPLYYHAQTALTFAPLMRLGIAQELERYDLEEHAVLSEEQRTQLKIATRDMKYETFDQYP